MTTYSFNSLREILATTRPPRGGRMKTFNSLREIPNDLAGPRGGGERAFQLSSRDSASWRPRLLAHFPMTFNSLREIPGEVTEG